jgi:hypothetical protein
MLLLNLHIVKRGRLILLIIFLLIVVVAGVLFFVGYFKPKAAGLLIETNPASSVFIEGEQVGRTPYETTKEPGEIEVKLVPESFEEPLVPYDTNIDLVSGVQTVIRRDFGDTEEMSAGETLSFEKIGGGEVGLSIVTIPDSAQISIDTATKAFAPYKTTALSADRHTLGVAAPGYEERTISIRTYENYELTAFVRLAKSQEGTAEEQEEQPDEPQEPKQTEEERETVEIIETPTGFLRVRSEPSTLGEEIGRVEPEEIYELLDEDEDTGWFKILFFPEGEDEEGTEGWISNQYAEKQVTGETTPTPTDQETPTP